MFALGMDSRSSGRGQMQAVSRMMDDADVDTDYVTGHTIDLHRRFIMPPSSINAKDFVNAHFGAKSNAANKMQFLKGTTTLAFVYAPKTAQDKGGVVIAVDSRASSGNFIGSATVMKILHISDKMVATMAGGAADCQFWIRTLSQYCSLYELREHEPISVAAASKYLTNVLYNYKGMGLSIGSMVVGVDKTGPKLYYIDAEACRVPGVKFSVGSGSLYAYGILDTLYQPVMTDQEALDLGRKAIMYATYRDIGSGGSCNVCHITPEGKTVFPPFDVSEYYEKTAAALGKDLAVEPILK